MRKKTQGKPPRTNIKWTYNLDPLKKGLLFLGCIAIAYSSLQIRNTYLEKERMEIVTREQVHVQNIQSTSKKSASMQVGYGIEGFESMNCWIDDQGNKTYTNKDRPMKKGNLRPCPR